MGVLFYAITFIVGASVYDRYLDDKLQENNNYLSCTLGAYKVASNVREKVIDTYFNPDKLDIEKSIIASEFRWSMDMEEMHKECLKISKY